MHILLLIVIGLPLLLAAWLFYFDKVVLPRQFARISKSESTKHLPEHIPGPSVFGWFKDILFPTEPKVQINLSQRKEYLKYGKEVGMYMIPIPLVPAVTICAPELIRRVFANNKLFPKMGVQKGSVLHMFQGEKNIVFNNGEDWKRQRTLMNPSFTNIERFAPAFIEKTRQCLDVLYEKVQQMDTKNPIPVHKWISKMVLVCLIMILRPCTMIKRKNMWIVIYYSWEI